MPEHDSRAGREKATENAYHIGRTFPSVVTTILKYRRNRCSVATSTRKIVGIIDTAFREFPWAVENIFWQ
jgi:hypothetical protein